jgi:hypothetical protein
LRSLFRSEQRPAQHAANLLGVGREIDTAPTHCNLRRQDMRTRASEPIVPTAVAAWRDTLAACEKMPTLVCTAGGVLFVLLFLNYVLHVLAVNYVLPAHVGFLAKIISAVARAFFLTPVGGEDYLV